jgi:hypothetical protein
MSVWDLIISMVLCECIAGLLHSGLVVTFMCSKIDAPQTGQTCKSFMATFFGSGMLVSFALEVWVGNYKQPCYGVCNSKLSLVPTT